MPATSSSKAASHPRGSRRPRLFASRLRAALQHDIRRNIPSHDQGARRRVRVRTVIAPGGGGRARRGKTRRMPRRKGTSRSQPTAGDRPRRVPRAAGGRGRVQAAGQDAGRGRTCARGPRDAYMALTVVVFNARITAGAPRGPACAPRRTKPAIRLHSARVTVLRPCRGSPPDGRRGTGCGDPARRGGARHACTRHRGGEDHAPPGPRRMPAGPTQRAPIPGPTSPGTPPAPPAVRNCPFPGRTFALTGLIPPSQKECAPHGRAWIRPGKAEHGVHGMNGIRSGNGGVRALRRLARRKHVGGRQVRATIKLDGPNMRRTIRRKAGEDDHRADRRGHGGLQGAGQRAVGRVPAPRGRQGRASRRAGQARGGGAEVARAQGAPAVLSTRHTGEHGAVRLEPDRGVCRTHAVQPHTQDVAGGGADRQRRRSGRCKRVRYEMTHSNPMQRAGCKRLDDGRRFMAHQDGASRFIAGFGVFGEAAGGARNRGARQGDRLARQAGLDTGRPGSQSCASPRPGSEGARVRKGAGPPADRARPVPGRPPPDQRQAGGVPRGASEEAGVTRRRGRPGRAVQLRQAPG